MPARLLVRRDAATNRGSTSILVAGCSKAVVSESAVVSDSAAVPLSGCAATAPPASPPSSPSTAPSTVSSTDPPGAGALLSLASLPVALPLALSQPLSVSCCPLALEAIPAGFPSPADDYVEARIDLNRELIPSPLSTYLMRVRGDAMAGDGIVDGDLLVIDRSVPPRPGRLVVALEAGVFIHRRLRRGEGVLQLEASDGVTPPIPLAQAEIWGVVIQAVHHLAPAPGRRH